MHQSEACHCGSNRSFDQCCLPYHLGVAIPPTAEALMRSRYTAYVLANVVYLKATWHANTVPQKLQLNEPRTQWLGLTIQRSENSDAEHAQVEFVARYKLNGRAHRLHEVSRFIREDGRWYYLDGQFD